MDAKGTAVSSSDHHVHSDAAQPAIPANISTTLSNGHDAENQRLRGLVAELESALCASIAKRQQQQSRLKAKINELEGQRDAQTLKATELQARLDESIRAQEAHKAQCAAETNRLEAVVAQLRAELSAGSSVAEFGEKSLEVGAVEQCSETERLKEVVGDLEAKLNARRSNRLAEHPNEHPIENVYQPAAATTSDAQVIRAQKKPVSEMQRMEHSSEKALEHAANAAEAKRALETVQAMQRNATDDEAKLRHELEAMQRAAEEAARLRQQEEVRRRSSEQAAQLEGESRQRVAKEASTLRLRLEEEARQHRGEEEAARMRKEAAKLRREIEAPTGLDESKDSEPRRVDHAAYSANHTTCSTAAYSMGMAATRIPSDDVTRMAAGGQLMKTGGQPMGAGRTKVTC